MQQGRKKFIQWY